MAMEGKKLKSILKKTVSTEQVDAEAAMSKPSVDARQLAVQHAQIIQHRKDLESQILDSIVILSEHPRVRTGRHSATNPAPADVLDFRIMFGFSSPVTTMPWSKNATPTAFVATRCVRIPR
jgi:hypothetical protein